MADLSISLTKMLEAQIIESDTRQSGVGEQRERNHRYYSLQPLGNEIPGRSRYISPDVMDAVEAKKGYFRETFFGGRRVVKFTPVNGETSESAALKTAYVERHLDKNDIYTTIRDGWHDAFVAKRMTLHVEWEQRTDTLITRLNGEHPMAVNKLIEEQKQTGALVEVDDSQLEMTQAGVQGQLRLIVDDSGPNVRLLQPERYFRDPHATYPSEAAFCGFEDEVPKGDLVNEGFDTTQVYSLKSDYRFGRQEEDSARKAHDQSWSHHRHNQRTEEQELVTVFWTYTWLDMSEHFDDSPEGVRLYKIRWASGEVLIYQDGSYAIEEVSEMPFLEWSEYKISHADSGMCDSDVVAHVQKTQSTLKRLAIDNQQMRNLSRWEAVQGNIKNPRELLDSTIGGVLWTKQIGSVAALPAPELSPLTLGVMEMLETDKESRTGLSRLSKGMNKDAISEQNADNMIARLTNSSNRRVMGEVRDFALTLWVPLMKLIYKLGVRNDMRVHQLEVAGQAQQAVPQQWPDIDPICEVHVALTPEEGARHAQMLLMMDQTMKQDPLVAPLYGVQQRHALYDDVFDSLGVIDTSRYMAQPGGQEHQQMMEMQQAQQQQQQQQMDQQQQFQRWMMQSGDNREWFRVQTEAADKTADNIRQDRTFAHDKVIDFKKVAIEQSKARAS